MVSQLLKTLAQERVFLIERGAKELPFRLRGVTRLVNARGKTLGIVIDKHTLDDIEEDLESQTPRFLALLEASRKSGRVPADALKRKAGLP